LEIIEFAGLPGAGKSTIAEGLVHAWRARGVGCESLREVLARQRRGTGFRFWRGAKVVLFLLRQPTLALALGRLAVSIRPWHRNLLARSWKTLQAIYFIELAKRVALRGCARFLVLDEGLFQALWSLQLYGTVSEGESVRRFFARVRPSLPTLLVLVDVGVPEAMGRMREREARGCRFDDMEPERVRQLLERNGPYLYETLGELARELTLQVIPIDGKAAVGENVDLIFTELARRGKPAGAL
jgi:thymidylate kinase